jgi:transcription termination factor Rho
MAEDLKGAHLADLHAQAAEQGIEGYRKLSRAELIDRLSRGGEEPPPQRRRRRRSRDRGDGSREDAAAVESEEADDGEIVVSATLEGEGSEEAVEADAAGPAGEDAPVQEVSGVLDILPQRYGFLRLSGLEAAPGDVYVSASQVRRCELRSGDEVAGPAREPRRGERHRALVHVDQVNGAEPLESERPDFDELPPIAAERRVPLDGAGADVLARAVDLLAPLALGQRVLVRAAPRSGRTTLLRGIASVLAATDGVELTVLLVDERPEEATAWREAVPGAQFAIATADSAPADQLRLTELALARARRRAESGGDAVLLVDSLSRLDYAAGDVAAVKRLFGAGRNLAGGGSLTVVATTLADAQDEGAAERAVDTTENAVITLDPELAAAGVHPAIVAAECRVSSEDTLREAAELEAVRRLREQLAALDARAAADLLRERIEASASNAELLKDV